MHSYVNGWLDNARETIMEACDGNERPLHVETYYLNPKDFYGKNFSKYPELI